MPMFYRENVATMGRLARFAATLPERSPKVPIEARAAPPSDEPVAEGLRGFGPLGILAILLILIAGNYPYLPLNAVLALIWVWRSRTPWREIGYVRPKSWIRTMIAGVAF